MVLVFQVELLWISEKFSVMAFDILSMTLI